MQGESPWQLFRMYALPAPVVLSAGGWERWREATREETLWQRELPFTATTAMLETVVRADAKLRLSWMGAWVERLLIEAKVLRDLSTIVSQHCYHDKLDTIMQGRISVRLWQPRQ